MRRAAPETESVDLRSDNEAPVAPEILAAIERANRGAADSYGEDVVTARLRAALCECFETQLEVFPVFTGTAANALAVAQLAPGFGAVLCHPQAHLNTDECGAPEFYSGGAKLIAVPGEHARIDAEALAAALAACDADDVHQSLPAALSLSQSTELGSVYSQQAIAALAKMAHGAGLSVHMDGARLANALAHTGCSPAELTWRAGVDILSFGATKNGALAAEAVVVFEGVPTDGLARRRKRAGQLASKMRFVSAQLEAYVRDDLWLRLARQANCAAAALAAGLRDVPGIEIAHPVESNEVFVRMPAPLAEGLAKDGVRFHRWPSEHALYRMVASYCTTDAEIDRVLACANRLAA